MNKDIKKIAIAYAVFYSMIANFSASFAGSKFTVLERKALKSGGELLKGKIEAVVTDGISPEKVMPANHRQNYLFKNILLDKEFQDYSTAFVYDKNKSDVWAVVFDYRTEKSKNRLRKIAINGIKDGIVYEIFNELVIKEHYAGEGRKESMGQEIISRENIKKFEELFDSFQVFNLKEDAEREQEE